MQKAHVEKLFLAWVEKKLSQDKQAQVEAHLKACRLCHRYYQKMNEILEKPDAAVMEKLKVDPYLASRLKAISGRDKKYSHGEKFNRGLRWSVIGVTLLIAVDIGIFVGKGLFQISRQDEDSQLVNAYYQAISQQTISDRWEYIFETQGEEQK